MDLESLLGGASGLVSGYTSSVQGIFIWSIIAAILAITGAILIYFLFVKSKTDFKGFAKNLRDYLSFKTMHIEALAKMFYYACTIYIVLTSINNLILLGGNGVLPFFEQLILYPLALRFAYEFVIVIVRIWKNTDKIAEKK
ncbi:hypothetical protein IJS18_03080 [Candidatus Saccharibacteria bacterium]|nr:hypothetical protein [Candidatus Saccharibacteria bacterium]